MAFEGWRPGSRSYRNCNPGNLRYSPIQQSTDADGYACFTRFAYGWAALLADITGKATGHTRTSLGPESTIYEFFTVYAPSGDNNHPVRYAEFVADRIGVRPEMPIKELVA